MKNSFILRGVVISLILLVVQCSSPPPPNPTGIRATEGYADKIVVTWDNVEGATGYNIYRSEFQLDAYELIDSVEETEYTDEEKQQIK